MKSLGDRISDRLKKLDKSQHWLAGQVGVKQPSINAIIKGKKAQGTKHVVAIANALGVSAEWLETGRNGPVNPPDQVNIMDSPSKDILSSRSEKFPLTKERQAREQRGTADKVPVLGMAECGPDGWALWNGEVVDYAPRPPGLMGVDKGYAVFVMGESMEPRYHPGELVYIHPGKPVTPGCYVLVQIHPKDDGDAPRAVLKRLVKRTGAKVILDQYTPSKRFELKADEIISIHRVVGSGEA